MRTTTEFPDSSYFTPHRRFFRRYPSTSRLCSLSVASRVTLAMEDCVPPAYYEQDLHVVPRPTCHATPVVPIIHSISLMRGSGLVTGPEITSRRSHLRLECVIDYYNKTISLRGYSYFAPPLLQILGDYFFSSSYLKSVSITPAFEHIPSRPM